MGSVNLWIMVPQYLVYSERYRRKVLYQREPKLDGEEQKRASEKVAVRK